MATVSINKSGSKKVGPLMDKDMKSHANDPFFVKKAKEAKALIAKYGLPKTNSK